MANLVRTASDSVSTTDAATRTAVLLRTTADAPTSSDVARTKGSTLRHRHDEFHSGLVPTGQLGTGTASVTTYLRGDQTWQTVTATGEVLMADGITAPPEPLETEARDDWLYSG